MDNLNPKCPLCKKKHLNLAIITPSHEKNFDGFPFKKIWKDLEEILSNAKEINIIGYSLPMDDKEIRYLLKKGIYNQIGKKNLSFRIVLGGPVDIILYL